jgi:hypothetical protein
MGLAGSGKDTVADIICEQTDGIKMALADPLKEFCQKVFLFSDEQLWGPSGCRNAPDPRYTEPKTRWWHVFSPMQQHENDLAYWEISRQWIRAKGRLDLHHPDWLAAVLPPGTSEWKGYAALARWFRALQDDPELSPRLCLQTLGTEWGRSIAPDIWIDYTLRRIEQLQVPQQTVVISDVRFPNEAKRIQEEGTVIQVVRPGVRTYSWSKHPSEAHNLAGNLDQYVDIILINDGTMEQLHSKVRAILK